MALMVRTPLSNEVDMRLNRTQLKQLSMHVCIKNLIMVGI